MLPVAKRLKDIIQKSGRLLAKEDFYKSVSYKTVLPPEKWPHIDHFLRALSHASKQNNQHCDIDIGSFINTYRRIYDKWSINEEREGMFK